ncbi:SHOCT domain-containing protein [Halobacteriales archaeon QH_10_67_13]|nr:MAG: SHOCT domain-containing protein [Halobacteriales archaeon QH_10_67_13]
MPPRSRLTPLLAVVTLPAGILAAIELGPSAALVVFVVGWLLLVPVSALAVGPNPARGVEAAIEGTIEREVGRSIGEESISERDDPLETARRRYARGEIDETELERRLAALLETEAVDPAEEEAVERTIERIETEPERSRAGGKSRR